MARENRPTEALTLAQLERLMRARKTELDRLARQRVKLRARLDEVDNRIAALSGDPGLGSGGKQRRARNSVSLQKLLYQVLQKEGKPMSVGDILDRVTASGYHSHSANFRGIINQTLIKDKRFVATSRGVYSLKK